MSNSPPDAAIAVATDRNPCGYCGDKMPLAGRADAKYCGDRCRYYAAVNRGRKGKVASIRELKDGRISVVIYMNETNLKPGQLVQVGLDD